MPRKGESIYKRKDGRWEGRYIKERTPQNKAIYASVYAKTYREVKIKQRDAIIMTALKTEEQSDEPIVVDTICSLAMEWLIDIQPKVKETTYVRYNNLLNSYILSEIGEVCVTDLTVDVLNMFCSKLLKEGGKRGQGLAPKTVADILSVVRNILQFAHVKNIFPSCTGREIHIRCTSKELCVLSRVEQEGLTKYLIDNLSPKNLGVLICLSTGMRIGEICALRWEDISIEEKSIYVHQTLQRIQNRKGDRPKTHVTITPPKSLCSIRKIPMLNDLTTIIETMEVEKHGFVLTGSPNEFVEPRTMQNHFKRVLMKAGIRKVNFHSLRHTFATRCIEVGFDIKSLSEILGHASTSITLNRYVHPSMELKHENMQRLSKLFLVK